MKDQDVTKVRKRVVSLAAEAQRCLDRANRIAVEIGELEKAVEGPMWVSHTGNCYPIAQLSDRHLANCIKVGLRMDRKWYPATGWEATHIGRQCQFAELCVEAHRRNMLKRVLAEDPNVPWKKETR